ncbi:hypothetical protein LTR53_012937 [Teratosphaeriaceae sp. CCFEE 6253]|nr:hypothetical protein LTR53_012937 [Teratosphaeriaceae sp. CCFEE 6253]
MASENVNGDSPAARMMKAHEESLQPHFEEVPDEDLPQPTPSAAPSLPVTNDPSRVATPSGEPNLSAKAAGKQPVREEQKASKPKFDTNSEEAFPALGGPKTQPAAAPTPWSRKPAAVAKAANMTNGTANGKAASTTSSRSGTPASGMMTPSSTAPSQGGAVQIPGRYKEAITLPYQMMTPRAQLKKPVPELLRDVNKRSKATITHRESPSGLILEGVGPVDAVRVGLKEAANQLCSDQKIQVPIPASIRGRIVGKQGATIQAISKRTGARINISKQDAAEILEDDDAMVNVMLEGDPFAVQMAKQDIEKIVAEHTSTVNSKLKHIPAEYYPFLMAQENARMNALRQQQGQNLKMQFPQYHTWSQQAPPDAPANRQPVSFPPQAHLPIQLSGDRQAVADARAEIERQVQELQRQITLEQLAMERNRHQFIVGDMGTSLQDFLAETGCTVIMPPDHDDSEMITIVGPPDRIEEATNKIYDLAAAMQSANADVGRQFANAPRGAQAHVRDMTRYLQQRQALAQLERAHNSKIAPNDTGNWQIYSPDQKTAMKARTDLMNLISGHPPTRFQPVDVDSFYHAHLREQASTHIRDTHGVHIIVPDDSDDSPVLLVFEDRAPAPEYEMPRKQPSAPEVQAFQQALQEAQQYILNLMNGHQEIVSKDLDAPAKFHDKIRRHVDKHHQSLPEGQIPVQVNYGGARRAAQQQSSAPNVHLRGPQDFVDALNAELISFIEQEKQDELERGFTLTFDFPQKYASHLIGQRGANINRLREEFDVDIQVDDGKCTVKGPEAKANACKKHLIEMTKKLDDEATHQLNIPQQYHKDLIGSGGAQLRRLQERYSVRVDFPRKHADDGASEAGDGPAGRRSQQPPNVVIVKGPSKGADGCRDELLSLLQYVKDTSHADTVSVSQSQLPSLIGSGGKEMEALRLETGAQIDVPNARDAAGKDGRVEVKLRGSKQAVDAAKKLIQQKAKVFDDTISRTLDVDKRHHRSNLRNIVTQAGGPEEPRLYNRMIRFPKNDQDASGIRVEGQREVVEQICAAIEALVQQQESQATEHADVAQDKHRHLIGKGGEVRRQLEQRFNVSINIPRQGESGPVRIAGQPEDVQKAKAHILELTKDQEGETIPVPRRFHHTVANNGQFFRNLRNNHQVTIDHAGQRPPAKSPTPTPNRAAGAAMPLITDDPSANTDNHHWELHELHSSADDGEIPWVLSGPSPEALAAARAKLERALQDAAKQDSVGFLILPDPRAHRHIIGQGGSVINRIRKESGANIQVPKTQAEGEAITITGSKDGVEAAREKILEVLRNAA